MKKTFVAALAALTLVTGWNVRAQGTQETEPEILSFEADAQFGVTFYSAPVAAQSATARLTMASAMKFLLTDPMERVIRLTNHPAAYIPSWDFSLPTYDFVYSSNKKLPIWNGMDATGQPKPWGNQQGKMFMLVFEYRGVVWEVPPGTEDELGIPNINLKNMRVTVEGMGLVNGLPETFPATLVRSQVKAFVYKKNKDGYLVTKIGKDGIERPVLLSSGKTKRAELVFFTGLYRFDSFDAYKELGATNQEKINKSMMKVATTLDAVDVNVEFFEIDPDFGEITLDSGFDRYMISIPDHD